MSRRFRCTRFSSTKLVHCLHAERQLTLPSPKLGRAADPSAERCEAPQAASRRDAGTSLGRVEQVLEFLGADPRQNPCEGMKGSLDEGDKL